MKFEELIGKTLSNIIVSKDISSEEEDIITFTEDSGKKYVMFHNQNCCESVYVEDICGNLEDLIGSPILKASEDTNSKTNPVGVEIEDQESFTWTFYNMATQKGHVTIRWYGESNGYYSESVDFEEQ